jgi:hypothetical protein
LSSVMVSISFQKIEFSVQCPVVGLPGGVVLAALCLLLAWPGRALDRNRCWP